MFIFFGKKNMDDKMYHMLKTSQHGLKTYVCGWIAQIMVTISYLVIMFIKKSKSWILISNVMYNKMWFVLISFGGQPWHFFCLGDRPLWLVHHPKQRNPPLTHWHTCEI